MKCFFYLLQTLLFVWLFFAAFVTAPHLKYSCGNVPEFIGETGQLHLKAFGGLHPPSFSLFSQKQNCSFDTSLPPKWRIAGICAKGFVWRSNLTYWPVQIGNTKTLIAVYLPQKLEISVPSALIKSRSNPQPMWMDEPGNEKHKPFWVLVTFAAILSAFIHRILLACTLKNRTVRRIKNATSFIKLHAIFRDFLSKMQYKTPIQQHFLKILEREAFSYRNFHNFNAVKQQIIFIVNTHK